MAHYTLRNWDAVAAHYGISKAAAHRLANDPNYRPSQAVVDKIRATSMPQPPEIPVPPCPDCGSVHHARCHGNAGAVVVLAPGETVRKPRGPWQSKARPEVAAMVRGLEACLARKAGSAPGVEVV
jgi:hypothetical protein